MFPVAGYGTRFLPATKSMPKEMLPVVNKPLVQYGVEEAIEAGMTTCAMVTGRGKRAIADHFDISYELEHQISGTSKEIYLESIRNVLDQGIFTMVRQREMKGLVHAILVADRDQVQNVKAIVNRLKKEGRSEASLHQRVYRPWGSYESLIEGDRFQVKRIVVNPGQTLSLQMHHHRAEHWIVVHGTAEVTCEDKVFTLKEDQSTYI
ncbi:unnamed protein product, partial [Discosporangium mesarthrocarpum]